MLYSVVILALFVSSGSTQGIINGDPYFCVPAGICPMTGGGIDPRIITPDGSPIQPTSGPGGGQCPSGRYVCYAQGSNSNCGQRLVTSTNTGDGEVQYDGAYPWLAYMTGSMGTYIGAGSLLSPYHVLTAAHKVLAYVSNPSQLTIIMGVNDPRTISNNPAAPRSSAAQITIFNSSTYNNNTLKSNLAIVRLANPISLVNQRLINTLCLPPSNANANTYVNPSQRCLVAGWGQIQPSNPNVPTKLKQVTVNTVDIDTCERGFNGTVNTNMYLDKTGGQICAGGETQRDACYQDGGAPLTCGAGTLSSRFTASGIVIWGKSCGQPGVYGVYTNVPPFRDWIVQTITQPIP